MSLPRATPNFRGTELSLWFGAVSREGGSEIRRSFAGWLREAIGDEEVAEVPASFECNDHSGESLDVSKVCVVDVAYVVAVKTPWMEGYF